eukprot:TRINITY_DN27825_c0_g1_i6.p3 TRINITY_DN27825_c0_g1~~TRINITY_DN27825_c0_g1_i6.p3  ORF type:complete len:108 (-),score=6.57 TRINITY_DN27825_c0_g1_i6:28-312(-)
MFVQLIIGRWELNTVFVVFKTEKVESGEELRIKTMNKTVPIDDSFHKIVQADQQDTGIQQLGMSQNKLQQQQTDPQQQQKQRHDGLVAFQQQNV